MDGKNNQIGKAEASSENMESAMQGLSTVPTTVTLSAEQFERLYLTPRTHRQTALTKKLGNPTPLWVYPLSSYPALLVSCLMVSINLQSTSRLRYHHDSTFMLLDGLAGSQWEWSCLHVRNRYIICQFYVLIDNKSGPIVFLGGLLLLITSIFEFILGNTFPCVVFGSIGKFSGRMSSIASFHCL